MGTRTHTKGFWAQLIKHVVNEGTKSVTGEKVIVFLVVLADWATDEDMNLMTPWFHLEKHSTLATLFSLKYLSHSGKWKHTPCRKAKVTCHAVCGQCRGWGGGGVVPDATL